MIYYIALIQSFIIIFLLCVVILCLSSKEGSLSSRLLYALISLIDIFLPKISEKNKITYNVILTAIISISICEVYSHFFEKILTEKLDFFILVSIPTLFSFLSINFIDLFKSLKLRIQFFTTKSEYNMLDIKSKEENTKKLLSKFQELESSRIEEM